MEEKVDEDADAYEEHLRAEIARLLLPIEELQELAKKHPPPPEWYREEDNPF